MFTIGDKGNDSDKIVKWPRTFHNWMDRNFGRNVSIVYRTLPVKQDTARMCSEEEVAVVSLNVVFYSSL